MRILLVTDAWAPQVNGVVRTLTFVIRHLEAWGHEVEVIGPDSFATIPCPTYPEIRLAVLPGRRIGRTIAATRPDAVHIATEGPLGLAARKVCMKLGQPFTTSYHTRFPEYVSARFPAPLSWGYAFMRWFHRPSAGVMVATDSLARELATHGFANLQPWTRGVDTELFRPRDKTILDLPRPIFLYVGRVAVEKNIGAFLSMDMGTGSKVVVGGGPQLAELARRHPDVTFTGIKQGEQLARHYAAADVFVFPSRTDTFGLVLLEALASGLPVAAYPVTGPSDVIGESGAGCLDEDLAAAARRALAIPRERCREHALRFSWEKCAEQFLRNLVPAGDPAAPRNGDPVPNEAAAACGHSRSETETLMRENRAGNRLRTPSLVSRCTM